MDTKACRARLCIAFGAMFLGSGGPALASVATTTTSYQLMLQSRQDLAAPNEVFIASFASLDDLRNGNTSSRTGFTQLGISPSFAISGFTADDSGYRVLLQSRQDAAAPNEVFLASFASLQEVFDGNVANPSGFTQIGISPGFKIAGFTYDPGGYRLLLQSRVDTAAPNEVFLATYKTLDDLRNANQTSPTGFSQIGISPAFEIAGFTYDPGGYRLLLQSRVDAAAPNEVFLATYATIGDLLNANLASPSGFTQIGISPSFRIAGLASTTIYSRGGVPEPSAWSLLLVGFGTIGAARRRSGQRKIAYS